MSRDNTVNIKAGGDVRVEALAVGDGAQAAAVHSAQAEKLAEHFLTFRATFEQLEATGKLTPAEAKMLKDEADDVHEAARTALEDPDQKDTLILKLKRFGGSLRTFCCDQKELFEAMHSLAAFCAIPLSLLGFGVP